jgi:DNA-binding IclR family transcriptional regulator
MLETELRRFRGAPSIAPDLEPTRASLESLVKKTRARGYAAIEGKFIPGLVAVAVPVLDWHEQAQCVVTLIGTDPKLVADGSETIEKILAFGREKSVLNPNVV